MKNLAVIILDLDKLSKDEWKSLWEKSAEYAHKIEPVQVPVLTKTIESLVEGLTEAGWEETE